ncbi:hypothetical protein ACEE96_13030 [Staphylococcus simulans]
MRTAKGGGYGDRKKRSRGGVEREFKKGSKTKKKRKRVFGFKKKKKKKKKKIKKTNKQKKD